MPLSRSTHTHALTSVKIDAIFAYVRKRRGPFAVARLVAAAKLRSTDPEKLGDKSYERLVEHLPAVLSEDEHAELLRVLGLPRPC